MTTPSEATLVREGKTKRLWRAGPDLVRVESKSDITAHDNPALTRQFAAKAVTSTTTTCRVFELLQRRGVPVAFRQQVSPTEFLAPECQMIPLEAVARRHAVGSYLKRHPGMAETTPPHRFDELVIEFFLKTSRGVVDDLSGTPLQLNLDPEQGEEDPLIVDQNMDPWVLWHSKKPFSDPNAYLGTTPALFNPTFMNFLEMMLVQVFTALEAAWSSVGFHFIDLKIEFGFSPKGQLLVADVIDNDSWRLRDQNWQELSKQVFRDHGLTSDVVDKYQFVAAMADRHFPHL